MPRSVLAVCSMQLSRNRKWRHTACLFLLVLAVCLRPSLCGTQLISTGKEFADALADNAVETMLIAAPVLHPSDADFSGHSLPITVTRDVELRGFSSNPADWPTINFTAVTSPKVLLSPNVTVTARSVVIARPRNVSVDMAPGVDMLVPLQPGTIAYLVIQDGAIIHRICAPAAILEQSLTSPSNPRPRAAPGMQKLMARIPQPDTCINTADETIPAMRRCWPARGFYNDTAVFSARVLDERTYRPVPDNMAVFMRNTTFLCSNVQTDECVATLGPIGCWFSMVGGGGGGGAAGPGADGRPTPPEAHGGPAGGSSSRKPLGAILGGVLGGVAAVLVALVLLAVWTRRRRQTDGKPTSTDNSKLHNASPDTGTTETASGSGITLHSTRQLNAPSSPGPGDVVLQLQPEGEQQKGAGPGQQWSPRQKLPVHSPLSSDCTDDTGEVATMPPEQPAGDERTPHAVVVTPLTPWRPDVALGVDPGNEVTLLPVTRGKGTYGRVVEGRYRGQHVAVKVVSYNWYGDSEELRMSFQHEVEVLGRCQHPNVVRLLAACLTTPRLCLVMELMETSLDKLIHRDPGAQLPLHTVLDIACDIASGLAYLHPTIVHRDLKPANVLISGSTSSRPVAKLADFGLSRLRSTVAATATPEAGTPPYTAPECFDAGNYTITHMADMYSFGCLLYEMLSGSRPWAGCHMVAIAHAVSSQRQRPPLHNVPDERCPPALRRLVQQCWDHDPRRRPAAAEAAKELAVVKEQLLSSAPPPPSASGSTTSRGAALAAHSMPAPGQHPPHSEAPSSLPARCQAPDAQPSALPPQSPRAITPRALDAIGRAGAGGSGSPVEQGQQGGEQQQEQHQGRPAPPSPPASVSTYGLTAHLSGGWLWRFKDARREAQEQEAGQRIKAMAAFM